MALLQSPRDRAVALILLLAVAIAIALTPFFSGLLGAAVLYVIFESPYRRLARHIKPGIAAGVILVVALTLVALPMTWLIGLVIDQAPDALRRIQSSDVLARVSQFRTGSLDIGAEIAKSSGTFRDSIVGCTTSRSPPTTRSRLSAGAMWATSISAPATMCSSSISTYWPLARW